LFPVSDEIATFRIRKPRALLSMIERAKELDNAPEGPVRVKPQVPAQQDEHQPSTQGD